MVLLCFSVMDGRLPFVVYSKNRLLLREIYFILFFVLCFLFCSEPKPSGFIVVFCYGWAFTLRRLQQKQTITKRDLFYFIFCALFFVLF